MAKILSTTARLRRVAKAKASGKEEAARKKAGLTDVTLWRVAFGSSHPDYTCTVQATGPVDAVTKALAWGKLQLKASDYQMQDITSVEWVARTSQ